MHSDIAEVKKTVRSYMIVFGALLVATIVTVAVNHLHFEVPIAITVALIIACIKGSMVGGVFMHLSHEKQWIYGSLLLTVVFFIVLMSIPILTTLDSTGTALDHLAR